MKTAPWTERARRLAAGMGRSDAAMLAFFFAWNAALLAPYLSLPFYWDAAAYVLPHSYVIYGHPWIPFVTGDYDVGHPTLFYWIVALAWRVFGVTVVAARMVGFAFGALLLLYVYKTGRRLGLGAAAFWSALMMSLIPLAASQTAQLNLDLPCAALFTAATYYFLRARREGRLALFATAMSLTKLTGVSLLAPMMILALGDSVRASGARAWRAHVRRLRIFAVPVGALAAFLVVRYFATGTVVAKFHTNQIAMSLSPRHLLSMAGVVLYDIVALNDFYLHVPLILAGLFFFKKSRGLAKPDFSWRRFLVYGLLAVLTYPVPQIVRALDTPLARYYIVFLPFLCLATGWALRNLWLAYRPAAAVLYAGLCALLIVHWHPKHAGDLREGALRAVLVNPWAYQLGWNGETNFAWADHTRCFKEIGHYLRRNYPDVQAISACFPESDILRYPFNGAVSRPMEVHSHYSVDQLALWFSQGNGRLHLRGSRTVVDYPIEEAVQRIPMRKVKEWHRHAAWYVLFEYDPRTPPTADR